jgi:hypothetical protein
MRLDMLVCPACEAFVPLYLRCMRPLSRCQETATIHVSLLCVWTIFAAPVCGYVSSFSLVKDPRNNCLHHLSMRTKVKTHTYTHTHTHKRRISILREELPAASAVVLTTTGMYIYVCVYIYIYTHTQNTHQCTHEKNCLQPLRLFLRS